MQKQKNKNRKQGAHTHTHEHTDVHGTDAISEGISMSKTNHIRRKKKKKR